MVFKRPKGAMGPPAQMASIDFGRSDSLVGWSADPWSPVKERSVLSGQVLQFCSKFGHVGFFMALFLTAYCAQPLLVDLIKVNGGVHSSTFLFLLPHYFSMMLVGLLPRKVPLRDCGWRTALLLSCIDIVNQLLKKVGLLFTGAAVYILIDSSSIVWTAIWSAILLKRRLNLLQWISIILIFVGVSFKAAMVQFSFQDDEFIGVLFVSAASISMGLNFVLSEHFMRRRNRPIPGPNLVCLMGMFCTAALAVWTIVWTIPQYKALVLEPLENAGGNAYVVLSAFACLFVTSMIHSSMFWFIIKKLGAVASGVLKGLKVASVFVLSHIFFCSSQPKQCLTWHSAVSAIICVCGVIMYSVVTASLHRKEQKEDEKVYSEEAETELLKPNLKEEQREQMALSAVRHRVF